MDGKELFLSFFVVISVPFLCVIFLSFCSAAVIPPVIFVSFCDSSAFFRSVLLSVYWACPCMCCKAAGKGGPAGCWSPGRSDAVGVGGVGAGAGRAAAGEAGPGPAV